MGLNKVEKKIYEALELLKTKAKFDIHQCLKGYPAQFASKVVKGKLEVTETKPAFSRTEFCIEYFIEETEIRLVIINEKDLICFENIVSNKKLFLNKLVGVNDEEHIDLIAHKVNGQRFISNGGLIDSLVEINFEGHKLLIKILSKLEDSILSDFISIYDGPQLFDNNTAVFIRIEGVNKKITSLDDKSIETLLNSIAFDLRYVRNEYFEIFKYYQISKWYRPGQTFKPTVSDETMKLVHKNLISELLDYFKVGERINYLPFKFLCYYHILEYFLDKSANLSIKRKLEETIYSSDFGLNSDKYIDELIKVFKKESNRLNSDKIKIQRVLTEFLEMDRILSFIKESMLGNHYFADKILEFSSQVTLVSLKHETEKQFFKSITDRIYTIRCSIVHSNPDFDERKAVPFVNNEHNLFVLEKEVFLLEEIARLLILKSKKL